MKRAIGIFDSGVGGLTVFKSIRQHFPNEDIIYFGDTARVPYGPKSANTIIDYSAQNARFLLQNNIKILIVACNTSSAVAIDYLKGITDIPIIGVIDPGAEQAVLHSKNHRIGVIGTEGTVRSNAYKSAITQLNPNAEVFSLACPLFVPLAEEGWNSHPTSHQIASEYLSYFADKNIDTLVLGCTHYPLLKDVISQAIGKQVLLVDSADAIAVYLSRILPQDDDDKPGTNYFFVSDNEDKFSSIGSRILGYELQNLRRVRLCESWFIDK